MSLGCRKKQRLFCNEIDTDCNIVRRESVPTSGWSFLVRYFEEPINVEEQMIDSAQAPSSASTTFQQGDAWQSLPWQRIEKRIFRLQLRIAKAIREKRFNRAKSLQWLLTYSHDAKQLAVKGVTENKGSRTPGVGKKVWKTSEQKEEAVKELYRRGYQALPLRRIYIPKRNGEPRPLGIPTMKDRAMQALHLLSL